MQFSKALIFTVLAIFGTAAAIPTGNDKPERPHHGKPNGHKVEYNHEDDHSKDDHSKDDHSNNVIIRSLITSSFSFPLLSKAPCANTRILRSLLAAQTLVINTAATTAATSA